MARIGLHNLRHSYTGGGQRDDDWALKQMDVEWEDGGAYALLGPSGCGKTTLLNIISGLIEPTEGRVTYDGVPLPEIRRESLLRQIAVVSQQPFLFNASVRENLAYGRPDADEEALVAAAQAAGIHDEILALPRGYDTPVGEGGNQ